MIPRVPARGQAKFKMFRGQLPAQTEHFQQRPVPKLVFVLEGGPRRGERDYFHLGPKPQPQIERKRLGQQRDVKPFRRFPQKGRGDDQIAQSPQFHNQQFRFHGGVANWRAGWISTLKGRPWLWKKFGRTQQGPFEWNRLRHRLAAYASVQADTQTEPAYERVKVIVQTQTRDGHE